jgi:hypothetical protein
VLGAADFVRALVDDPLTKVIAVYLEGVRDGLKFQRALFPPRGAQAGHLAQSRSDSGERRCGRRSHRRAGW